MWIGGKYFHSFRFFLTIITNQLNLHSELEPKCFIFKLILIRPFSQENWTIIALFIALHDLHFLREFKLQESFKCAILSLFAFTLFKPLNRHELDIFSSEGLERKIKWLFILLSENYFFHVFFNIYFWIMVLTNFITKLYK